MRSKRIDVCRDQRGIALVMALGILVVLSITAVALLTYTAMRGAPRSPNRQG